MGTFSIRKRDDENTGKKTQTFNIRAHKDVLAEERANELDKSNAPSASRIANPSPVREASKNLYDAGKAVRETLPVDNFDRLNATKRDLRQRADMSSGMGEIAAPALRTGATAVSALSKLMDIAGKADSAVSEDKRRADNAAINMANYIDRREAARSSADRAYWQKMIDTAQGEVNAYTAANAAKHQNAADAASGLRGVQSDLLRKASEGDYQKRASGALQAAEKYGSKDYEDTFGGLLSSNYGAGRLSQDSSYAWNEYVNDPTPENRRIAELYDAALTNMNMRNGDALAGNNGLEQLAASWANYAPQFLDQTKARIKGGAAGALVGHIGSGQAIASAADMYSLTRGAAFKGLIDAGVPEGKALEMAKDEALISSIIEYADSLGEYALLGGKEIVDLLLRGGADMAGTTAGKAAGKAALKKILAYVGNYFQEGEEERSQEAVSIANERRGLVDSLGQYGKGNIDLYNRPQYTFEDGSIGTVNSITVEMDGKYYLIPTIARDKNGNAVSLTDDQAVQRMRETGEYLGVFDSLDEADEYAEQLHKAQEYYYLDGAQNSGGALGLARNALDVYLNEGLPGARDDLFNKLAGIAGTEQHELTADQQRMNEAAQGGRDVALLFGGVQAGSGFAAEMAGRRFGSDHAASAFTKAQQEYEETGAISDKTAQEIARNIPATDILQSTGKVTLTDDMTLQQKAEAVKEGVSKLMGGKNEFVETVSEKPKQEAKQASKDESYMQMPSRMLNEQQVNEEIRSARQSAATLGRSGARAFETAYTPDVAQRVSSSEAFAGFAQVYNAALKGQKAPEVSIPNVLKVAAEGAGKLDRQIAAQAKFFGANAGLAKNRSGLPRNISSRDARMLDAIGKAAGIQIRIADTLGVSYDAEGRRLVTNASMSDDGVLTIAKDAIDPVRAALTHEVIHRIRQTSPEAYQALSKFVIDNMSDEKFQSALRDRGSSYADMKYGLSDITEETVADAFGVVLGNSEYLDKIVQTDRTAAQKLLDAVNDLIVKVKRALTGKEEAQLDQTQVEAFRDLQGKAEEMAKLLGDALEKVKSAEHTENAATEGGEVRYDRSGAQFVEDKYFARQMDKWDDLSDGKRIKVGVVRSGSALNQVGLPATGMWFDVGKIKGAMDKHGDHLAPNVLKGIPDLLNDPIVISEYTGAKNTVSVYGNLFYHDVPVVVGIVMHLDRTGSNVINNIRTIHARSNFAKQITDDSVLYLNPDKKKTRSWFQVCGISNVPLEGTKYGLIRSIAYQDTKSNPQNRESRRLDADYMKAVESGDTEAAQKMVGEHIAEKYGTESVRFSMRKPVEETKNLIALHNLSAEKLGKVLKLGGFPMPSIAVTKADIPHTHFGDITLVMNKSAIDPKANRKNTVYSADAWTPTFPSTEYEANEKVASNLRKRFYAWEKEYGRDAVEPLYGLANYADDELDRYGGEEGVMNRLRDDTTMMKLFLRDKGIDVPAPVTEEKVERLDDGTIKFYDHFIKALGEDVIREATVKEGQNPREVRKAWWEAHGEDFEVAYRQFMKNAGFSDETIEKVLEHETVAANMSKVVAIRNYLNNGPEKRTTVTNTKATNEAIRKAFNQTEYEAWLNDLLGGIEKSSGIYNGTDRYTPSGNSRSFSATHYPVTLENIARAMAKENGGDSRNVVGFHGVKTLRAGLAKRFSSIAEMHEYENRLQNLTEEEADKINDALAERLSGLMGKIYETKPHSQYSNAFMDYDSIGEILMEAADQKEITVDSIEKLFAKYGYKLNNETAMEARNLLFDISQMPVNLFEAKPERAVRFDEVLAAVVPQGTDAVLVQQLKDAGVQNVMEYEKDNDADRLAKVNSVEGAKFSRRAVGESREAALMRENDLLREQLDYWKAQTKRTPSESMGKVEAKDVRRTAKELLETYDSTLKTADIEADLQNLYDLIGTGGKEGNELSYEAAREIADGIARKIAESALDDTESAYRMYEDLRKYMREMKLTLSQRDINQITDYNDWRKRNMGRMTVSRGETSNIDRIYDELSDRWPEFFPGDVMTVDDQLARMADVMDYIYNDRGHNPFDPYMDQAVIDIGNDIMERFFDLPQAKTFADKQAAKIEGMRARMAEMKRENETRLREAKAQARAERNDRLQELKDHYAELAERRRERRNSTEERNRLLRIARRLQGKKVTEVNRAWINEAIGDLDLVAKSMTGKTLEKLTALRDWYESKTSKDSPDYDPNFLRDEHIESMIKRLAKRQIKDLTNEEVRDLTDVLLNIENEIRTQNKLIESKDKHDTYMAGVRTIQDIENSKGLRENVAGTLDKMFVNGTLSPVREMHRLTGYTEDDPLYVLTKELADGQRKMFDYQRRAYERFLKWTEDKKLVDHIRGKNAEEIKITGIGKNGPTEVTITPAMRMSLYLHSLNDQNLRHIAGGGITVPDAKLYKQGKIAEAYDRGTTIKLEPSQVRNIVSRMTMEEKAFAEAARAYFNGMSREAINETSEKLKGYSLASVDNYFPIDTDKSFLKKDFDTLKFDGTLEGMGFLKERINSAAPIMLYDMDNVLRRSIEQHSKYYGLAIPVRNFSKVWGVTQGSFDENGNRNGYESSVQQAIKQKWGGTAFDYIEKMMTDLQSGNADEKNVWSDLLRKVRSNYAGAVLTLNASVAMKQAASYPTAAAVVGWGPLMRALPDTSKVDTNLIAKYTPLLWYRSQGFSNQELGDMAKQDKQLPKLLNWIQGIDLATTRTLWKAAEFYVQDNQDLRRGSDEYYKAVAEVYNRIIEETQPNYTTMQRPQLLRSNNTLMQSLMMFKTQPFQNFNVLYDALGNLSAKKRAAQIDGSAEAQVAYKTAKKKAGWAITSQVVQLAVFAGMTAAWNALRGKTDKYKDDDDDEVTVESALKRIGRDMLGGAASMIPFGSDLWEYASSKLFNEKYYGFDEVTSSAINDMFKALSKAGKSLKDAWASMASGEKVDWNKQRHDWDSVLKAVSKVAGIPYENVENLFDMAFQKSAVAAQGKYKGTYAYLLLTESKSSTGAYYDNLYGAYQNDKAAYEDIYRSMLENGFDADKIKDAMESRMKKKQGVTKASELSERYMNPEQKTQYDRNLTALQRSTVWSSASSEQQDKVLDLLYGLTTGANDSATKSAREKIEGGASVGIDETEYLLYKVALAMADTNGNGADQKESEAAVEMLTGLTQDEKSYLWASPNKSWADSKNNPYKTGSTRQKVEVPQPTIEAADVSGSSAIKKAEYDPGTQTATITWSGGGTYTYNVSPSEWQGFKNASSKGSYANRWK